MLVCVGVCWGSLRGGLVEAVRRAIGPAQVTCGMRGVWCGGGVGGVAAVWCGTGVVQVSVSVSSDFFSRSTLAPWPAPSVRPEQHESPASSSATVMWRVQREFSESAGPPGLVYPQSSDECSLNHLP